MGYVSARTIATAVALTLFACGSPASAEGDAGEVYQARFALSGFLLRAGYVCQSKLTVEVAIQAIATPELKAIMNAYPDTTKEWMSTGGKSFNDEVMANGIGPACTQAAKIRRQMETSLRRR